ncbi:MAG: hypothetical protein DRH90_23470 [Deltaproteobacteria bacterium]|nr:MAG: hypothetical protein DRH90_23470 [Deltaproteobacteria bacterium]
MRKASCLLVIALLLIALPAMAFGWDSQNARESLAGLDGVRVLVEVEPPDFQSGGFSEFGLITGTKTSNGWYQSFK